MQWAIDNASPGLPRRVPRPVQSQALELLGAPAARDILKTAYAEVKRETRNTPARCRLRPGASAHFSPGFGFLGHSGKAAWSIVRRGIAGLWLKWDRPRCEARGSQEPNRTICKKDSGQQRSQDLEHWNIYVEAWREIRAKAPALRRRAAACSAASGRLWQNARTNLGCAPGEPGAGSDRVG